MTERILLVQGNTRPQLIFTVRDENTAQGDYLGDVINLNGCTLLFKMREAGATEIKAALPAYPVPGFEQPDGSITMESPYDLSGVGGRAIMDWTPEALDTPGDYEAELDITFPDATVQTVYRLLKLRVREAF